MPVRHRIDRALAAEASWIFRSGAALDPTSNADSRPRDAAARASFEGGSSACPSCSRGSASTSAVRATTGPAGHATVCGPGAVPPPITVSVGQTANPPYQPVIVDTRHRQAVSGGHRDRTP